MDPFYFTTDLDYAFGANSGFNPETDAQVQAARRTAAAKSARVRKPTANKRAAASKSRRLNYEGNLRESFARNDLSVYISPTGYNGELMYNTSR